MENINRRKFTKTAGAFTLGSIILPGLLKAEKLKEIGLQMYTLRTEIDKDPLAVLKKIASIGYNYIEIYASSQGHYFGYKPIELKKITDDLGIKIISMHAVTGRTQPEAKGTLTDSWPRLAEEANSIGIKYIVCPWLHQDEYKDLDACLKTAEFLNEKGAESKKLGLGFAYHNHDFEFSKVNGQVIYDLLLNKTDKNLVKFEMDLYWMVKGGQNPLEYFKNYPGRFPLWHVKDMDKADKSKNADVGTGSIDFKKIFHNADKAGMEHFFVEQETYKAEPMDSVKNSFIYLKNLNY